MALSDTFLKLDGIDGESTDAKHPNEINVLEWGWSESQAAVFALAGVGGGGAGKVQPKDFRFKMHTNTASPKLLVRCASGEPIKKALLTCRKAGKEQVEFLKITFSDVLVSSYDTGCADLLPTDTVTLNFARIEVKYFPQKKDGTLGAAVQSGYDFKQMAAV